MAPKRSQPSTAAKANGAISTPTASSATTSQSQSQSTSSDAPPPARPTGPKSFSLVWGLIAFILLLSSFSLWAHYRLPTPQPIGVSTANGDAQFSEEAAMEVMQRLSVDIGYRIVGTREHVAAEDWLEDVLRRYEGTVGEEGSKTQVEVWKQVGDGAHRFDFMSSVVWKKYYSMSNLIVRISDGTDEGKQHALLLNAHLDSTLPSPGGADDGAGVAVLLETLRVLTTEPRPKLRHAVILLFNNGEESLQDASHLYITQHETRDTVRAVVNLEACGTSGPELLFQATSEEMIRAYSKVPHPFGTVLANDVFSTGLILSDTDFRQFVQYGGLAGLDMALVGNSYLYHTRKDVPANIERGAIQHMGENVLAIVKYLTTSPESQLPNVRTSPRGQTTVYFSLLGKLFILLPPKAFRTISLAISAFANFQLSSIVRQEKHFSAVKLTTISIVGAILSIIAAFVGSNVVAVFMVHVLGKGMSWYRHEWLPMVLYGPPAVAAILMVQYAMASLVKAEERPYFERATMGGMYVVYTISLLVMNAMNIGSAYLMALGAATLILTTLINDMAFIGLDRIIDRRVHVSKRVAAPTYFIMSLVPAIVGSEGMCSFLDLFVPLTGRMGEISPVDNIIATITAALTFLSLPAVIPMAHRFGQKRLGSAILVTLALSAAMVAVFASPGWVPFDEWHPKRLFVHQVENITSGEWFMNVGSADPAPGFAMLVDDLQRELGLPLESAELKKMDEFNTDFDILYPVSNFITPYKFRIPTPEGPSQWTSPAPKTQHFMVHATNEVVDPIAGTRKVKLEIEHPGIIWSVIAFDADVLEWDLSSEPPKGYQRHHIKEVSRYGLSKWSINLTLRLDDQGIEALQKRGGASKKPYGQLVQVGQGDDPAMSAMRDPSRLWIDFSGLDENGMWPQKAVSGAGQANIKTFRKMDGLLRRVHPEVDAMLLGVVSGVVVC